MKRRGRVLVLALLAAASPAGAQSSAGAGDSPGAPAPTTPEVSVTLAPGRHTVGDRVETTLAVTVAGGALRAEPRFPEWPADGSGAWGEAEVVEAGPVERTAGGDAGDTFRQRLVLVAFAPGRVALPPLAVALPLHTGTEEARTPADFALTIESVLPPAAAGDGAAADGGAALQPRPASPPRPLPVGAAFWWTAGVLAAACLAVAALALRRARRAAAGGSAPAAPALAPFAELTAAIERARREGSVAAAHTLLSRAVRRYLGRTLHFPAPESTTSEIQRALTARTLPPGATSRLVDLLRGCDLVKFARLEVEPGVLAARAATALAVAADLERHLQPAPPAEEAAA